MRCSIAGIVQTSTPDDAFNLADVAILVGSMPRREGMERADLLSKNGSIFKVQGVRLTAAFVVAPVTRVAHCVAFVGVH